jgi:hypothetical protein
MSERNICPNGSTGCDFAENHEIALAGKVLRMIESYSRDHHTYPCPECLRNSIMAIAALLHIEAAKIGGENGKQDCTQGAHFVESFAETARERMASIMEASADFDGILEKRTLM